MSVDLTTNVHVTLRPHRRKLLIGTLAILAAVAYLIITGTAHHAQYFLTVDELQDQAVTLGDRLVRVSGAVVGDSIQFDPKTLASTFTIAHMPGDPQEIDAAGGLAAALRAAVANP